MKFSKGIQNFDSSGIRKVFNLAAKLKNPVNLSIGEPDFKVAKQIKSKAISAIKNNKNKYTQTAGILYLRKKVALKLKKENNISTFEDNVIITAGTSGALHLLFSVLINSGDEVIIIDPYFVIYKQVPEFFGAKIKTISSYPDFSLPTEKIKKAITPKTKMVIINSPNNPTGSVYSKKNIKNLVDILKKKNILLVSDEVYEKFIYNEKHFSPASIYKNTITLNGFSKSHALTGWRIGYAVGPRDIISEMIKLQQYTYVCPSSVAQISALSALDIDICESVKKYRKKRDLIYKELSQNFEVEMPKGAFYIFPKASSGKSSKFTERAIKNNLLIVPGSVFSQKDTHFRISYAASFTDLKKGVKILNRLTGQ